MRLFINTIIPLFIISLLLLSEIKCADDVDCGDEKKTKAQGVCDKNGQDDEGNDKYKCTKLPHLSCTEIDGKFQCCPEAKKEDDVEEQRNNKGQSEEQNDDEQDGPTPEHQDDVEDEEQEEDDEQEQENGATDMTKDKKKKKGQTGKTRTKKNTKRNRRNRHGRKHKYRGQLPTCEDKYDGCKFRPEDCISMKTRRWRRAYRRCRKTCNRCKNELIDVADTCEKEEEKCDKDQTYDFMAWVCPKTCGYTLKTRPHKPFGKNPKKKMPEKTSEESSEE